MRLKTIEIRGYKCFEKYKVDFAPSVTVIIGRDGAGKTTLSAPYTKCSALFFPVTSHWVTTSFLPGTPSLKVSTFGRVGLPS